MKLSHGGSIVDEVGTEVIVPLGLLTSRLQFRLTWTPGRVRLSHPVKGEIEVMVKEGCPLIPTKQALELIEEIEERTLEQAHLALRRRAGRRLGPTGLQRSILLFKGFHSASGLL